MRKALILGAGGTGARSIMRIRDLIEWRLNKSIDEFQNNIQYFEIDTDPNSLEDGGHNFLHLNVSADAADKFKREMDAYRHSWADRDGITEVINGAGETRVKGKFAFLYHYDTIKTEIAKSLHMLYRQVDNATQKKQIYIIANSVSGTGSGCFVDYGYLVRKIIKEDPTYSRDTYLNVTLILTLPAKYDYETHFRNSYYALEELNHFMSGNFYRIEHPQTDEKIEMSKDILPFNYVYLIGPKRGGINESQDLENVIGEYIYNDIFSPSADTRDSARDNMNKFDSKKDRLGYCQKYMTFGFSTIEYPILQIAKAATYKHIEESIKNWQKNNDKPVSYDYKTIFLGDGDYRQPGNIYYELLKEATITINGTPRKQNITGMIKQIAKNAFKSFADNNFDTIYINNLMDLIDAGFDDATQPGFEYGKGTINAIISENARNLKREEDGWGTKIKDALLDEMFNKADGLRLTEELLEQINKRFDNIANQNTDEHYYSGIKEQIESVCNDIDNLRADKLLKIGNLHVHAVNQRVEKCRKKIDEYVCARLTVISIKAAKELVLKRENSGNIRKSLDNFKNRARLFKDGINTWLTERDGVKNNYEKAISPQVLNGHIVWQDKISKLADDLIVEVGRNMFDFVKDSLYRIFRDRLFCDNNTMDQIFFKKNDKTKIIGLERPYFIEKLKDKKVIREFLQEEQNKTEDSNVSHRDTIIDVNQKADFFIDLMARDSTNVGDKKTLIKKWFFYPGGQNITQDSIDDRLIEDEADDYAKHSKLFARELNRRRLIIDYGEQSKNSSDDRTILVLQEQGGFPLRYLNLLYEDQMTRALINARSDKESGINTFISRNDVDFLPLRTIDASEINSVKMLFIISIATGKLKKEVNGSSVFTYEHKVSSRFGEDGAFNLPDQYKNAIYKLYRNDNLKNKLRTENEKYIIEEKMEFLKRLDNLLDKPEAFGLVLDDYNVQRTEINGLICEEFIKPRGLLNEWNNLFPDAQLPDGTEYLYEYIEHVDDTDRAHPNRGWYCKTCGCFMGDVQTNNNEKDDNAPQEFYKIHVCSR